MPASRRIAHAGEQRGARRKEQRAEERERMKEANDYAGGMAEQQRQEVAMDVFWAKSGYQEAAASAKAGGGGGGGGGGA